ncbi:MAG: SxtJ family membrane protein [Acidobacteria bacterium]|nr:SxtJ family membrane protein [Acidobacteriota bacterium]
MITIDYKPGAREVRSFSRLWLPLFVAALGGVIWWRTGAPTAALWVWGAGGVLIVAALSSPHVARLLFVGLVVVTYPIGLVVSYVILGAMFFLVFTPLGWAMRRSGRDPLALAARARRSHWVRYEQDDRPERAFRQF